MRPSIRKLVEVAEYAVEYVEHQAEHAVDSMEAQAKDVSARGDAAYRARQKLEDVLRRLGVL